MLQAASLPETVFTVWINVFERSRLAPGETFLVQGGSSGIGVTAIQMARAFGHRVSVQQSTTRRQRSEAEILRDREIVAERELLMHHTDAGGERIAGAREMHLATVDEHSARVGRVDSGEDLSERAFPRPVLAA